MAELTGDIADLPLYTCTHYQSGVSHGPFLDVQMFLARCVRRCGCDCRPNWFSRQRAMTPEGENQTHAQSRKDSSADGRHGDAPSRQGIHSALRSRAYLRLDIKTLRYHLDVLKIENPLRQMCSTHRLFRSVLRLWARWKPTRPHLHARNRQKVTP